MELILQYFEDDGSIPNNSLPVIIYKEFFTGAEAKRPEVYEELLDKNGWGGGWRNGLFGYHHYHSSAHEVLCVFRGWVEAQLGGESGRLFKVEAGDVLVLPAGVGHKNIGQGGGFSVIGSYPSGQHPDMNYGKPGERPGVDEIIASVPVPPHDPLLGRDGGIMEHWQNL